MSLLIFIVNLGNCTSCGKLIENEANVVNGQHYHPTCFTCDNCKNPLGAEKYFILKGQNYCKDCKDVSLNSPNLDFLVDTFYIFGKYLAIISSMATKPQFL